MKLLTSALLLTLAGCATAQETTPPTAPLPARNTKPAPVAVSTLPLSPQTLTAFPIHDNDVWVMVGDSITWQKLYTAYIEAFVRARYPRMPFAVVHSGKSGEVYIQGLIRFRKTVAAYKPTFISVNFGMNDHTKIFPSSQNFLEVPNSSPQRFVEAAKALGARVAVVSASPLIAPADWATDGGKFQLSPDTKAGPSGWRSNPVNKLFADKMHELADREGAYFIDQQAPLQLIWAANYGRDAVAAIRDALVTAPAPLTKAAAETPQSPPLVDPVTAENWRTRAVAINTAIKMAAGPAERIATLPLPDKDTFAQKRAGATDQAGTEALRLYLLDWVKKLAAAAPPFVRLSGYTNSSRASDLIHPNQAGHLHMAGAILKQMKADGLVSEVALDAPTARLTAAKKATVTGVNYKGGALTFQRLDESLPFPIDPVARPALEVDVATPIGTPKDLFGLSRYLLTVTGLPAGNYEILIDGEAVATCTAAALAKGVDLGLVDKGPIYNQTQKLWRAVQTNLVDALEPRTPEQIAAVVPKVLPEAQPVVHTWTVRPSKS